VNPSKADAEKDDPTIRRCVGFARGWGYGGFIMVNLYGLRSTDPKALKTAANPVGRENGHYLTLAVKQAGKIVCAWGLPGFARGRAVAETLIANGYELYCLGMASNGAPLHPLRLRKDLKPIPYDPRAHAAPKARRHRADKAGVSISAEVVVPTADTLKKYGLTPAEWLAILDRQGGVCGVCGKVPTNGRLCTDHEHVKGFKKMPPHERKKFVRGLIDFMCNKYYVTRGITVAKAKGVAAYLEAYEARKARGE
jgi:hypothetical protein